MKVFLDGGPMHNRVIEVGSDDSVIEMLCPHFLDTLADMPPGDPYLADYPKRIQYRRVPERMITQVARDYLFKAGLPAIVFQFEQGDCNDAR